MAENDIIGISDTYKRPIIAASIVFGAGPSGGGSQALRVLVCGMKTSSGTIVVNAPPVRCYGTDAHPHRQAQAQVWRRKALVSGQASSSARCANPVILRDW